MFLHPHPSSHSSVGFLTLSQMGWGPPSKSLSSAAIWLPSLPRDTCHQPSLYFSSASFAGPSGLLIFQEVDGESPSPFSASKLIPLCQISCSEPPLYFLPSLLSPSSHCPSQRSLSLLLRAWGLTPFYDLKVGGGPCSPLWTPSVP